jgi:hypothetical protein
MKIKSIPIALCCLIAAGVVLINYAPARAEVNLGDGVCSGAEKALNYCIEVYDYVIEAIPCENGEWPCLVADDTLMAFAYRATAPANCDSPTWSYSVTQYEKCEGEGAINYILDTEPDGAALSLPNDKVAKCEDTVVNDESHELWKLNPTLNCSNVTQSIDFTIYADPDVGLSCGNMTWVRTKIGCEGGLLRGPGCGDIPVKETTRSFRNGQVQIQYDICFDGIVDVNFSGADAAQGMAWVCAGDDANPLENGGITDNCSSSRVYAGPEESGCVIEGSWNVISPSGTAYVRPR